MGSFEIYSSLKNQSHAANSKSNYSLQIAITASLLFVFWLILFKESAGGALLPSSTEDPILFEMPKHRGFTFKTLQIRL